MADIVSSLFGLTPEAYRQQQATAADRMALEYAKLDPLQSARFAIGRGAYELAGALGGALGGQDPMLQMISNRQAIARQVDYTNPESMASGVQALADAGDTVGAMQLSQFLRQAQGELAGRTQKLAAAQASLADAGRQRTEESPNDVRIAREFAAQKGAPGSAEYNAEFIAQLTRLTTKPERAAEAAPESVRVAQSIAKLLEQREALSAIPDETGQTTRQIQIIDAQLAQLQKPEKPAGSSAQVNLATAIADAQEQVFALQNQPASPARDAQLRRATSVLQSLERQLPREAPSRVAAVKEIGIAVGTGKPVLLDDQGLFVYDMVDGKQVRTPYSGAIQSKAAQVTQTTTVPGGQEKAINANKADLAGQIETGALNSEDRITLARNMMSLLPRAFTGLGADVKLSAARVAELFGISVTGTTESEIIDQILGQMTIGAAGQLKGALSDKDREFLKQTIGTRGFTRAALQFAAERIERNARIDAALNREVNDWQSQKKSLNDFNFVEARTRVSKKIDAEIARYRQLKAKKEGGG